MKLQINITKDILKRSMMCGTDDSLLATENCAIALAIRDLFQNAFVGVTDVFFCDAGSRYTELPNIAVSFIKSFDRLSKTPEKRLNLPEFSFEIDVPEEVIDRIGLNQVYSILENHSTMKICEV